MASELMLLLLLPQCCRRIDGHLSTAAALVWSLLHSSCRTLADHSRCSNGNAAAEDDDDTDDVTIVRGLCRWRRSLVCQLNLKHTHKHKLTDSQPTKQSRGWLSLPSSDVLLSFWCPPPLLLFRLSGARERALGLWKTRRVKLLLLQLQLNSSVCRVSGCVRLLIAALAATVPASSSSPSHSPSLVGFFSHSTAALSPQLSWRTGKGEQRQNGKCNGREKKGKQRERETEMMKPGTE